MIIQQNGYCYWFGQRKLVPKVPYTYKAPNIYEALKIKQVHTVRPVVVETPKVVPATPIKIKPKEEVKIKPKQPQQSQPTLF